MNTELKTPEQWFQMLKEPYRSEAIERITLREKDLPCNSLTQALWDGIILDQKSSTGITFRHIYASIKAGETTYLETELKPQDMISGDWYVIDVHNLGYCLVKFKSITNERIIMFINGLLIHSKTILSNKKGLCFIDYIKSIRKATREEVLKHFPDEFKDENKTTTNSIYQPLFDLMCEQHNARLIDSKMQEVVNVCEKILEARKDEKKEVESEEVEYLYFHKDNQYLTTKDLDYALQNAQDDSILYTITPIGTKVTKSILEPIKK